MNEAALAINVNTITRPERLKLHRSEDAPVYRGKGRVHTRNYKKYSHVKHSCPDPPPSSHVKFSRHWNRTIRVFFPSFVVYIICIDIWLPDSNCAIRFGQRWKHDYISCVSKVVYVCVFFLLFNANFKCTRPFRGLPFRLISNISTRQCQLWW